MMRSLYNRCHPAPHHTGYKAKGKMLTKSPLISRPEKLSPHIIILGAGASVAAFPDGDVNRKKLPIMNNIIETIGIDTTLKQTSFNRKNSNFEAIFSDLSENDPESPLLREIEDTVYAYFDSLRLPEYPTLYDHILMSLRPKDIVATFNWDPFLFDAWNRNKDKIPLPKIVHLHGNVRVAHCPDHPVWGEHGMECSVCNKKLIPTPLLYPIKKKNYTTNQFINTEWTVLKQGLRKAMTLTIFGYSAPNADKEAVDMMKTEWDKASRFNERTEVIDIKDKEELWELWDPFIVREYFDYNNDFYQSRISQYPRRTCEALVETTFHGIPVNNNPLPVDADFDGLFSWLEPFVDAERLMER